MNYVQDMAVGIYYRLIRLFYIEKCIVEAYLFLCLSAPTKSEDEILMAEL